MYNYEIVLDIYSVYMSSIFLNKLKGD